MEETTNAHPRQGLFEAGLDKGLLLWTFRTSTCNAFLIYVSFKSSASLNWNLNRCPHDMASSGSLYSDRYGCCIAWSSVIRSFGFDRSSLDSRSIAMGEHLGPKASCADLPANFSCRPTHKTTSSGAYHIMSFGAGVPLS